MSDGSRGGTGLEDQRGVAVYQGQADLDRRASLEAEARVAEADPDGRLTCIAHRLGDR